MQFWLDGRLVASARDEQGKWEVLVATVPPSGALWQISTGDATGASSTSAPTTAR